MANTIELAMEFIPLLDEVYKNAALTSKLDGASDLAQRGANANELIIPMLDMQGLGDYSRNGGYVDGDVSMTNETVKCNFDRGRMFTVDTMDNMETAGIAFGRLAGEFIRTKVVPELDAFRFAKYASKEGIAKKTGTLSSGETVVKALRDASTSMDELEVPLDDRHLFITPTLYGMVQDMDTTKSREVMARFTSITQVPQTRFYTAIKQKSGKIITTGEGENATTTDETAGGYTKDDNGKEINFMVIHKPALIQFEKHVAPKIIEPGVNQTSDGYKFGYRNVGIADIYANKLSGVYLHHKA